MIRHFGLFLIASATAVLPAVSAQAQYYPSAGPTPYYRSAPPDIYEERLPPPGYYADDDDNVPVRRRPPRDPRYSQTPPPGQGVPPGAPSNAPNRILPYPDEADAAPPPPPGFAQPNGRPTYGHQLDAQSGSRSDPDVMRPPAAIGPA